MRGFYRACGRPVYTLIRRLIPQVAATDDLFQEVFFEILRNAVADRELGAAELVSLTPQLGQYEWARFRIQDQTDTVRAPCGAATLPTTFRQT